MYRPDALPSSLMGTRPASTLKITARAGAAEMIYQIVAEHA